jgi:hypothetical protein
VTISIPVDYFYPPLAQALFLEQLQKNNLGVAMFGVFENSVAEGVTTIEPQLGFLLPKIFASTTLTKFSDPALFKLFNRTSITNRELAVSTIAAFAFFKWARFNYICSELGTLLDLREQFQQVGRDNHILMENQHSSVPFDLTVERFHEIHY